jgi:hypothetical protein
VLAPACRPLPPFAAKTELSLVQPLTRPLVVQLLLRLLAAELPECDEDAAAPLEVPEDWEAQLAHLLAVEEGEAADSGWLGEASPLEGASFFDVAPKARLRLLVALADRRLREGVLAEAEPLGVSGAGAGGGVSGAPPPPSSSSSRALASAVWHGAPLGTDNGGARYWAVPGEARVHSETRGGEWSLAAGTTSEVRALALKLAAAPGGNKALCDALLKSLLPPIEAAAAERARAAERAAERARREDDAAAVRAARGCRASLRPAALEEAQRRAAERAAEEAKAAAVATASADAARAALRALVPSRYHTAAWEASLYAAAALGERSADARSSGAAPTPQGAAALGHRVSVFWPSEKAFFPGTVAAFSVAAGVHTIRYDDGDTEKVTLSRETVEWLD